MSLGVLISHEVTVHAVFTVWREPASICETQCALHTIHMQYNACMILHIIQFAPLVYSVVLLFVFLS